jgi:hypothetical protein
MRKIAVVAALLLLAPLGASAKNADLGVHGAKVVVKGALKSGKAVPKAAYKVFRFIV